MLQKPEDDDFAIIGGHVRPFETAEQALWRLAKIFSSGERSHAIKYLSIISSA